MKLRRFCRVVISEGSSCPRHYAWNRRFPKPVRVAKIQHTMPSNRRTFLKTTAAGVASITTAAGAMAAPAEAQARGPKEGEGAFEPPRGMTLLNMRTAAGPRLGVKLAEGHPRRGGGRGELQAAGADRHRRPAPERQGRDAREAGGGGGRWAGPALSAGERRAACAARHPPREDHHDGLQLPAARGRDRHADSREPHPLQQVQQRAQSPQRHHRPADGDGEAVRLRNRAGDRLRPRVPQRVGSRRARLRGRLLHRQRLLRARHAVPHHRSS